MGGHEGCYPGAGKGVVEVGKGGGAGLRGSPEFRPPTSQGTRGRWGWPGIWGQAKKPRWCSESVRYWRRGSPGFPSGFGSDGARKREGRSGELRPLPRGQTGETEERFPPGNLGLRGGMRTPFISGGTCGGGTLRRVARGAREVLSSSAAEAAAAATRMDFLSHRNSPSSSALPRAEGSRPPVTRPSPPRPGPGWARPTT